jgi:hypothetical protein
MGTILKRQKPFPSFSEVKNDLLVEEISMAKPAVPSQALITTTPRPLVGPVPGGSAPANPPTSNLGPKKKNKNKKNNTRAWPSFYNPWTGLIQMWPGAPRGPLPGSHPLASSSSSIGGPLRRSNKARLPPSPSGMLPGLPGLLHTSAGAPFGFGALLPGMPALPLWMPPQVPPPLGLLQTPPDVVWDHNDLAHNFNTMTLTPPPNTEWYMDSGASSHMASNSGILSHVSSPNYSTPTNIVVDNGSLLPVTSIGHTYFPSASHPLYLYDVLVSHDIIKNLISVSRFKTDNLVSVEFDPFGLSMKDLQTRNMIIRCNSSRQLYPLFPLTNTSTPEAFLADAQSSTIWHRRLGHLSDEAFSSLARTSVISCNKFDHSPLCHACQLGHHTHLPFSTSSSRASQNFDLIHCDLWTSPVAVILICLF